MEDEEEHELQDLNVQAQHEHEAPNGGHQMISQGYGGDDRGEMPSDVVDAELNRRVIRKLDFILLPFLALLFLFNSLDKSNIGNKDFTSFRKDPLH